MSNATVASSEVRIEQHGSLALVTPVSQAAQEWLVANVHQDSLWYGGSLVVEPRYLDGLIDGLVEAGLL